MSWLPTADADTDPRRPDGVEMVILPRASDIGGLEVRRALPFRSRRMVGPFIFWDQMGPGEFLRGRGIDVRPHPHVGLTTVTYLLSGSIDHRDSLGNDLRIHAGDVNLMTAGAGIVHSERTGQDVRQRPSSLFGVQSWLAQPRSHEDRAPEFTRAPRQDLPTFDEPGISGRLILGEFMGVRSPVATQWPSLYVDVCMERGAKLGIPATTEERAIYTLVGRIEVGGVRFPPQQMLVLRPGDDVTVVAQDDVRLMILGGAVMDGPRYIDWNFVSSSKERLARAREDWRNGRFPIIPSDADEFTPLPDDSPTSRTPS
ncbi:MAG TPA: pirin family protein [Phycisphaerales bacterium]|nr:pirin family protein [Phycisphaerales bacterium]